MSPLGRFGRALRWVAAAWNQRFGDAELSIFFDFMPPPYGGGNQFLLALKGELERQGVRVGVNYVGPRTRAVLVNSMQVDEPFLRSMMRPGIRVVHRVDGPISVYRGEADPAVDRGIADHSLFADLVPPERRGRPAELLDEGRDN